jgi:hypothetical protein
VGIPAWPRSQGEQGESLQAWRSQNPVTGRHGVSRCRVEKRGRTGHHKCRQRRRCQCCGNGGALSVGDINSGGNAGNAIGIGDTVGSVGADGGSLANSTIFTVSADGGTAIADASGGDNNLAFTAEPRNRPNDNNNHNDHDHHGGGNNDHHHHFVS